MRILYLSTVFLLIASPAHACLFGNWDPLTLSLQQLRDSNEKNVALKSDIDAAVWGVFLDKHSDIADRRRPLSFSVGGKFKGNISDEIKIITSQTTIITDRQIYHLNLRQIHDDLWTDIRIPQVKLNWDEIACDMDPKSTRCSIYQLRQSEIKYNCIAYLRQMSGCWFVSEIPKVCEPYVNEVFAHP